MINSFGESAVWKRTATFWERSLLSLAYCLMVMLGGMLFTNESHAQTCDITNVFPGVRVVVQNVGTVGLHVRESPTTKRDNHLKTVEGDNLRVYDKHEGTILLAQNGQHSETHGKYIWYYVKWDRLPAGWTAGIIDDQPTGGDNTIKWIATTLEAYQKDAIMEALFNGEDCGETKYGSVTHDQTKHDYNDYGCNANWGYSRGYLETGHTGWDVVVKGGDPVPFYSLTAGKLLPVDRKTDGYNTIAIYDEGSDRTVLYLHAHEVLVEPSADDMVYVGQCLGTQGRTAKNLANATGVHVHIEVQKGKSKTPAWQDHKTGIIYGKETIPPVPYLYKWVADRREDWTPDRIEEHIRIGQGGGSPNPNEVARGDVNGDGEVDLFDQFEVLKNWGRDSSQHDVNGDGVVNLKDWHEIGAYQDGLLIEATENQPKGGGSPPFEKKER